MIDNPEEYLSRGEVWSIYGTTDVEKDMLVQIISNFEDDDFLTFQRLNDKDERVNFRGVPCPRENILSAFKPLEINVTTKKSEVLDAIREAVEHQIQEKNKIKNEKLANNVSQDVNF